MWSELATSHPPPLFMRFLKRLGRGINAHTMISRREHPHRINPGVRENVYRSLTNIDYDYLP